MSRLNRFFALLALVFSMAALGAVGGMTTRSAFAQAEEEVGVIGGGGCENDECEGRTTCQPNGSERTRCDMVATNVCETKGC